MGQALDVMQRWFENPRPELLADTVEWHVPGYPVPQDTYHGPQAVFGEFFPALTSHFAQWGAETEKLIEASDGERVTVLGHYQGSTKAGAPITVPFIHVWTVRDGRITHVVSGADTSRFAAALS